MGLIADYMEDLREHETTYDPCLVFGYFAKESRRVYKDIGERIRAIEEKTPTPAMWQQYTQEFVEKLDQLESLKNTYLLEEKALLSIKNDLCLRSTLVKDLVREAGNQIRLSYSEVCTLSHQIKCQFPNLSSKPTAPVNEDTILRNLLHRIIASVLHALKRNTQIDTSHCRKIVSDCAQIIKKLEQEQYNLPDKEVFDYYVSNSGNLKKGNVQCCNCGKPMLSSPSKEVL